MGRKTLQQLSKKGYLQKVLVEIGSGQTGDKGGDFQKSNHQILTEKVVIH